MPGHSFTFAISLAMLAFLTRLPPTFATLKRPKFCQPSDSSCRNGGRTRVGSARMMTSTTTTTQAKNVLGGPLEVCCTSPQTGYYRDGFCHTGPTDHGVHTVCAVVTDEFLQYSKSRGNDLTRAVPEYGFPGLKDGDKWCLCVSRWKEAYDVGKAPGVVLRSTNEKAVGVVSLEELRAHAIDA